MACVRVMQDYFSQPYPPRSSVIRRSIIASAVLYFFELEKQRPQHSRAHDLLARKLHSDAFVHGPSGLAGLARFGLPQKVARAFRFLRDETASRRHSDSCRFRGRNKCGRNAHPQTVIPLPQPPHHHHQLHANWLGEI